jgi:hypothetical protein
MFLRIHTPGPSSAGFKDAFQQVGAAVWQRWDEYLGDMWNSKCSFAIMLRKSSDPRLQDDEESEAGFPSKKVDSSVPWDLLQDKDGWPLLPLELALPLAQLKEILRSCFTIAYRKFWETLHWVN